MVGKVRLYQRAGSPLIQGYASARRRRIWPGVLVALLLVAAAIVYFVYFAR